MPQGGATGYQREYLLMLALLRKGENDKAVAEAKALVAAFGQRSRGAQSRGGVFAAAGQPDAAREQFNEALKLKPNDPQTLLNLARLDLAEGKTVDAEARFPQGAGGRSEEPDRARWAWPLPPARRATRRKPRSGCRRPLPTTPNRSTRSWRWRSSTWARATSARRAP